MDTKEKKIASKEIYKGKIIDVYVDKVLLPNGNETYREVVRHCKASAILAFTDENTIILENQFRYPYDEMVLEIPAGKCDKDEDPKDAAVRELEEETGYRANNITFLGEFYPTVAYTDEIIYLYLATDLVKTKQHLDADENLDYFEITFDELLKMIKEGKIKDGKTLAAINYFIIKIRKLLKLNIFMCLILHWRLKIVVVKLIHKTKGYF